MKRDIPSNKKKRIASDIEDAVIMASLKDPLLDQKGLSLLLADHGIDVSPNQVEFVWKRHSMLTFHDRLRTLLDRIGRTGDFLTRTQVLALKKLISRLDSLISQSKTIKLRDGIKGEYSNFEDLISELSTIFINLPVDRIDEKIVEEQKRVCEALNLHRSVFMEFSKEKQTLYLTHFWVAEGCSDAFPPMIKEGQRDEAAYIKDMLNKGRMILFSDVEELPNRYKDTKMRIREIGINSAMVFPFDVGENIIGGISWESHGINRNWTKVEIERLRLISQIFANALSRKKSEDALRESLREIKKLKDKLQADNLYLLDELRVDYNRYRIVGQSAAMRGVLKKVEQVAGTSASVLILGETGTGKEMLARAIHDLSPRNGRPMVKINCSSLPPTLIENELFGHERGAYTGAVSRKSGRFEVANGSTLFLDEIGDLPLELQAKLLRVLQEGEFERVGSTKSIKVDVRIISATNHDLQMAVKEALFRMDLYYRLSVFPIEIPPLRERPEDIPLLVKAFAEEFSQIMGKEIDSISADNIKALQSYHWPGNIRELRNVVEHAMIICTGKVLYVPVPDDTSTMVSKIDSLDDMQRKHISWALQKTGGHIFGETGAAKMLDIHPKTLISRMERLGLR